jgi:hypothetical protein
MPQMKHYRIRIARKIFTHIYVTAKDEQEAYEIAWDQYDGRKDEEIDFETYAAEELDDA